MIFNGLNEWAEVKIDNTLEDGARILVVEVPPPPPTPPPAPPPEATPIDVMSQLVYLNLLLSLIILVMLVQDLISTVKR